MGFGHRYEPVNEGDDVADDAQDTSTLIAKEGADIKQAPQHTSRTVVISWWKFLLCNLLAAVVGAGATFLIARFCFSGIQPSGSSTAVVAASPAPTSSAGVALPTLSTEHKEEDLAKPNPLTGKVLDCGYSPEEARAKGCVYDVMMQDWVPEPCYDEVLTKKYLAEGNWTWYGAGDGSVIIPDEEMAKGEHGAAWMSTSYHKAHCVFSWQKIIRALRNNRGISQELLSYDHVLHCAHGALKADSEDEGLGVRAPTNYAKCALYDTWIQDLIPDKHNSTLRK
ncbi:hypothetical protein H2200_009130 [Cladophialophora chaetospira]|uniref:Uncharacterized protein n=1 Tax=Cladophialophora chaetospira TaxID=386627 RepID=A0AA38X3I5_9EURO|nr:hypothetical protein H2200_009130 [Cladophialophora chaetospira]